MLTVGKAYKFFFTPSTVDTLGFDALNGVYYVRSVLDYPGVFNDGGDLNTQLYKPAGKTQTDLNTDITAIPSKILRQNFYKLQSVKNGLVIYAPVNIVMGMPQGDVKEYSKLMMAVNLGVFANPTTMPILRNTVFDVLRQTQGLLDTAKDVSVTVYESEWLTADEYADLENRRTLNRAATSGFTNYYTEAVNKDATILAQSSRIAQLEELVASLHKQLNP